MWSGVSLSCECGVFGVSVSCACRVELVCHVNVECLELASVSCDIGCLELASVSCACRVELLCYVNVE